MRRRVLTGARLHAAQAAKWRAAMLTLTYRPDAEWDRRHISGCARKIRLWLRQRGIAFRYVWVMELTKAGKPHYHMLIWLPQGCRLPMADDSGWWPHGMTRTEWARHAAGYVSKYVGKGQEGAALPKGARMYGVGGLENEALDEARWWALPGWLQEAFGKPAEKVAAADPSWVAACRLLRRSRCGGGWADTGTGECFFSPWKAIFFGGGVFAYRPEAFPDFPSLRLAVLAGGG